MLSRTSPGRSSMTAGRNDKSSPPGPGGPAPLEGDGLLTSDDLFAELVDAPLPAEQGGFASRPSPIRVKVSDPVSPSPFAVPTDTPAASNTDAVVEDAFNRLGSEPKPVVFRPAPPAYDDQEARLPPAAHRTSAKLLVTDPKIPLGPGVDLASVALSAIHEEPAPPAPAAPQRPAPAREASWRDDRFGPYQLIDRVAIGGMAEVFKAKREGVEGFEKIVAVKRILPHLSENKEFLDMFVDEAKMVAGLAHPNIVQIFDLGRIDKSYYIAMEYVHGRDLRTIMRRAREKGLRMPLDLSLRVVGQVCGALEYAHRKKDERGRPMEIVHRDVSPQNILISFEGDVKLVDFGIAKAATKASNTDRGALRGKLLYMSPEQAWGRPIDRRSDVFSLGIVLYEMVTETKPFVGAGTEVSILELVRQCVITPAREINPREPDDRYQDAGQMQRGLERFLRERPPVSARDLARFLELLFDRAEREDGGERPPAPEPSLEAHTPEPMPLEALLKRFGIDE